MHHDEDIPMLYFDQLATIAKHLDSIKYDTTISETKNLQKANTTINETKSYFIKMLDAMAKHGTLKSAKAILPKNRRSSTKLTRRKLKMLDTWHEWKQSEMKQLNQYHDQNMFGSPCPLPIGANVLDLIWTYAVKDDGTKKARCVCNGQPRFKGTVIFGYTFAKMLDHVASRIFWAIAAAKNLIVRGADASNTFAEASAPKLPLFVRIDQQYR